MEGWKNGRLQEQKKGSTQIQLKKWRAKPVGGSCGATKTN
jgi:hypothetical protein